MPTGQGDMLGKDPSAHPQNADPGEAQTSSGAELVWAKNYLRYMVARFQCMWYFHTVAFSFADGAGYRVSNAAPSQLATSEIGPFSLTRSGVSRSRQ